MQCHDLREIADSYLSDELMVETNHDVLKHLESCADCRRELAARRAVRAKLREAFKQAPDLQMSEEFASRLRAQLRTGTSQNPLISFFKGRRSWMVAAACCLLAALLIGGIIAGRRRERAAENLSAQAVSNKQRDANSTGTGAAPETPRTNDNRPAANLAASLAVREISETAAGDHRNCAVTFRLAEPLISLKDAGRKYDPAYFDLARAVLAGRDAAAEPVELVKAHSCVFEKRRFGHVILKYQGRLVSVLVTDLEHQKDSSAPDAGTASDANAVAVAACPQVAGYHIACFETARHAVYVVSDLNEADHMSLARALAPSVYRHVSQTETVA
ncbi:MAG: anti-sigma factor [Pyrinomonadaceae bacterium]